MFEQYKLKEHQTWPVPLSSVACIGQKYQVDVHIWKTLTNDARPELFSSIKFDPFAGWCSEHVGDTMMQIANNSVMQGVRRQKNIGGSKCSDNDVMMTSQYPIWPNSQYKRKIHIGPCTVNREHIFVAN